MDKNLNIKDSQLFNVYIHELLRLSSEIKLNCEDVFERATVPESGYLIQVSPDIHSKIIYILINAANIKKIIKPNMNKTKYETKEVYEYRKSRANAINKILKGIDLSEMLNNKVRNTLEHFDEYLDKESLRIVSGNEMKNINIGYNMTLSDRKAFSPELYPLRIYISSERAFYNMGFSIDIGKIYEESLALLNTIADVPSMKNIEDPGGMIIKIY